MDALLDMWAYLLDPAHWSGPGGIPTRTAEHVWMTFLAVGTGTLLAVPLGMWLERRRAIAEPVIRAIGVTQTIPSIALLAFMIPLLGIGTRPALAALWIYSIFPILRSTYTGVRFRF